MKTDVPEFLDSMLGILERLKVASADRGQPLLASILEIAKVEAEDSLRHERDIKSRDAERSRTSSAHSWRACDRPAEEDDQIAA
jgi:hypothetical protein